jgi:hypothetical protein
MKAILFLWHGQDQEIWMDIEHLPHYESHLMSRELENWKTNLVLSPAL